MNPSDTIPIGGSATLIFSVTKKSTGEPRPDAVIENQTVSLTDPSIANFSQDSSNPNIFHFTGLKTGTTQINCTAVISV